MQSKSITKLNKTALVCLFLYAIITLFRLIRHVPFFDEAHAWTIAEQLNYFDMLKYIKNEGHFFVWQTILYPFAKLHLYPYSMQILNWLFCTIALIVMWCKAPFNNVVKALITFSFPFLGCYSVLARCYSIGIMLLFILASMHENRLKYPKTYAFLLILCANTSIMALIGASALGLMFIYDIFKQKSLQKRDYALVTAILSVGVIAVLLQVLNIGGFSAITNSSPFLTTLMMFLNTFVPNNLILNTGLNLLFFIVFGTYFLKEKTPVFFYLFTIISIVVLGVFFYGLNFWHSYFFFIYLIMSFWLVKEKVSYNWFEKVVYVAFGLISFAMIFNLPVGSAFYDNFHSEAKQVISIIENGENLKNSTIIHNSGVMFEVLPYSINKTYKIKNYCSTAENSDYDLFLTRHSECVKSNIFGQAQKFPDTIKGFVERDKNVFAFTPKDKNPQINNYGMIFAGDYNLLIKKYKCEGNLCFWKVEIK